MVKFQRTPERFPIEHAFILQLKPYKYSQQLRVKHQSSCLHKNKQWRKLNDNKPKYQGSNMLYTRHLQGMNKATIHHIQSESLHRFPLQITWNNSLFKFYCNLFIVTTILPFLFSCFFILFKLVDEVLAFIQFKRQGTMNLNDTNDEERTLSLTCRT